MLGTKDKGKQKGHLRSTVSNGARMQTRGERSYNEMCLKCTESLTCGAVSHLD